MAKETYTVVLRGGDNSSNVLSGDATSCKFSVNWRSVLPEKYRKFRLNTFFRTHTQLKDSVTVKDVVYVESDAFPKQHFYDSLRNGNNTLVAIAPIHNGYYTQDDTATAEVVDESTTTYTYDNRTYVYNESKEIPLTVNFPHQDVFSVELTNIAGELLDPDDYTSWVLVFNFEGIEG